MKKDKQKTKVQFLYNETNQDLFAFFPYEVFDSKGNKAAYSQTGQHSACHPDYAIESREATPEEYKGLKIELEGLGYNLEILNKSIDRTSLEVKEYRSEVIELFRSFIDGKIDESKLLKGLQSINRKVRKSVGADKYQSLWFRFFKNDTLANTPQSVYKSLTSAGHANRVYKIECIKEMLEIDGLIMYCS
jgi:hypothetical protein